MVLDSKLMLIVVFIYISMRAKFHNTQTNQFLDMDQDEVFL